MVKDPGTLATILDTLEALHGPPARPVPQKALHWILWENCAYLVPDERRLGAYAALKKRTGLRSLGILALPREELHELAALGGMQPERRVEKLLSIARTVEDEFGGNLQTVLKLPSAKARKALKRFPGIGDPGAAKILLFTGSEALPALDSNGLRVLVRLGYAEESKSYSSTYRACVWALEPHRDRGVGWLMRAHDLLRAHGRALCKNSHPRCDECPLAGECPAAS